MIVPSVCVPPQTKVKLVRKDVYFMLNANTTAHTHSSHVPILELSPASQSDNQMIDHAYGVINPLYLQSY